MAKLTSLVGCVAAASLLLTTAPAAWADARATDDSCPAGMPAAGFTDVPSTNSHASSIDCVVHWKIAQGTGGGRYTPAGGVNRAQMATFIARLITESGGTLPSNVSNAFDDDDGNTHESSINALAAAQVVNGKGPRTYSPNDFVTRDQMATFLVKAFEYRTKTTLAEGPDAFDDDTANTHERAINRAAAAGFASGTGARTYAPKGTVRRDQMASFLARVLDKLVEDKHSTVPPAPPENLTARQPAARSFDCRTDVQVQINGTVYPRSARCSTLSSVVGIEYDLGRNYRRFTTVMGQVDGQSATDQTLRMRVLGDGRELAAGDMTFGTSRPLELDVSGVLRLRLEIQNITAANRRTAQGAFGDPTVQAF